MKERKPVYQWAVVGAGPGGIAIVGKLIDNGVDPESILWVDPEFMVGDLGTKWSKVRGNTMANRQVSFLRGSEAFGPQSEISKFPIFSLNQQETCELSYAVEPLQWITERLKSRVAWVESRATGLRMEGRAWRLSTTAGDVTVKNVVLALGSDAKKLDYDKPVIALEDAFDSERLATHVKRGDKIAVFGSLHSGMYVTMNLIEDIGARVVNIYRSDLRFAKYVGKDIENDNDGLKEPRLVKWVHENVEEKCHPNLERVKVSDETPRSEIEDHIRGCSKVVYGIGFGPRGIPIEGVAPSACNNKTGEIAPGLFKFGFMCPERVLNVSGREENNVGLFKFMNYATRIVPIWMTSWERAGVQLRGGTISAAVHTSTPTPAKLLAAH